MQPILRTQNAASAIEGVPKPQSSERILTSRSEKNITTIQETQIEDKESDHDHGGPTPLSDGISSPSSNAQLASSSDTRQTLAINVQRLPKIIARYHYPSEHRKRSVHHRCSAPQIHKPLIKRLSLFSLIALFFMRLFQFIYDEKPAVIEFQPEKSLKGNNVRFEAHVLRLPKSLNSVSPNAISHGLTSGAEKLTSEQSEKVIRVMAVLDDKKSNNKCQIIEIEAEPKRVRQLLYDHGEFSVENVFEKDIKAALRKLR